MIIDIGDRRNQYSPNGHSSRGRDIDSLVYLSPESFLQACSDGCSKYTKTLSPQGIQNWGVDLEQGSRFINSRSIQQSL